MNAQERALKILQAEAWDEGYYAAVCDLNGFDSDGSTTPNPYDKLAAPLRFVVNEENRPIKTPRSVIQEIVTYE